MQGRGIGLPAAVAAAFSGFALLGLVFAAGPAFAGSGVQRCHGRRMLVKAGRASACLAVKPPSATAAKVQSKFDSAVLAARLQPVGDKGKGKTLGALLGSQSKGLDALESALAGGSKSKAGWSAKVTEKTPAAEGSESLDVLVRHGKAKITLKTKDTLKFPDCPDAAGEVPGSRTRSTSLKIEAPLSGGRKLVVSASQSAGSSFLATTDEGAALATIALGRMKLSAEASGEVRDAQGKVIAKLGPRSAAAKAEVPMLGPAVGWPAVLTDPDFSLLVSGALEEAVRGGGASLDPLLRAFVVGMQSDVWSTYAMVRQALLAQQQAYWQGGRCVQVYLERASLQVPPGAHDKLEATAYLTGAPPHPKHGGVGSFHLSASVTGGASISPGAATTKAAEGNSASPVAFDFTAPGSAGMPMVTIKAVSRQGVGTVTLPVNVVGGADGYQYAVTMHGSGRFFEEDTMQDSESTMIKTFDTSLESLDGSWPTVFVPARVPSLIDKQGASAFSVTGTAHSEGSYAVSGGSEHFSCVAGLHTLGDPTQDSWLRFGTPSAGGEVPLSVQVFGWLEADQDQSCVQEGAMGWFSPEASPWGTDGGEDVRNLGGSLGSATLTPADFAGPSFAIDLASPPFPSECSNTPESGYGTNYGCSHSLSWTARLTFTKLATCTVAANTWSCKRD